MSAVPEQGSSSLPEESASSAPAQDQGSSRDDHDCQRVYEAVQQCNSNNSFSLSSEQAKIALSLCRELSSNFYPKSTEQTRRACNNIITLLEKCIPTGKFRQRWREKMWKEYHRIRMSELFTASWSDLFISMTGTKDNIELLYQHISDIIFENLLSAPSLTPDVTTTSTTQSVDITYEEENALRYISGYVIFKIKKKLTKSKHSLRKELLIGLNDFVEDNDSRSTGFSADWVSLVDRGGLCKVTEDVYTFFYEMEVVLRRFLCIEKITSFDSHFKESVIAALKSDDDVMYVWSQVTVEVDEAESKYLLDSIINLYFSIRGNSFVKSVMELYKLSAKRNIQKSKGLRKKINTD